ncbi:MAG TPA: methyltransferase domain-containing protein [Bryobacteraceae bacterium]|nr:methyltransferase domain-containing protein [Bryobacteraceae bacterium]
MILVHSARYTLEDQQRMSLAKNYFAWQHRLIDRELGARVLEVGSGIGNFTAKLLARDAVIAVDLESECVQRLTQRFPHQPNLHSFACDVLSPEFRALSRFQPDSAVIVNVLEHVEQDAAALEAVVSVIAPGGSIVLLIPAFPSLYGPIDKNLGHHRRYTRRAIRELAEQAGLRVRKLHYMNSIGFFGWWINAHILKRESQSESQIRIFDRYIVPPMSTLERRLHPPFGQSLLAVLTAPSRTDSC